MYVNKLSLLNFRNYENGYVDFSNGINLIYGPNAKGKTNVLEAINYVSAARSHRMSAPEEMIRFNSDFAKIKAEFYSGNRINKSEIIIFPDKKKQIKINGVPVEKTSELMGFLKVVFFCPEDLRLVKGSPRDRRRMLDLGICRLKQRYFNALGNYKKILQQRNVLLKDNPESDMIWVWDEKLIEAGAEIILHRKSYLDRIEQTANRINTEISEEKLELIYDCGVNISDFSHKGKIEEDFRRDIEKNREKEIKFHTSFIGPHRDDFLIRINGTDGKQYASQGQQRTAAISLKMAELETVKEICGENPVLLLDDVLSELDEKRRNYILEKIEGIQVIITSTDAENFSSVENLKKIYVEEIKNVSAFR